ncbi:hypothetical protein ONZ45_g14561 [Pleurotus djamor]|nr:hypothetical protein ONZ45_g14561 [Pleurotus djamor]
MGDVLRLKDGSQTWWTGPEARKRGRTNSEADRTNIENPAPREGSPTKKKKRVAFEDKFVGGGGRTYTGVGMIPMGDDYVQTDRTTFYHCEVANAMVPLPKGFAPMEEEEEEEGDFWA